MEAVRLFPAPRTARFRCVIALALTEAVTTIADGEVSVKLEAEARKTFDEETYAAVIFAIVAINSWNRLAIVGHKVPGSMRQAAG